MLIWVCALHCEAKPVIDYYRLKKFHDEHSFDLYLGEKTACIVSGIGKIASAAATAWAAAKFSELAPLAWINLGIAGAASRPIGSILLVNQIIDPDSGRKYFPVIIGDSPLERAGCLSLNQPGHDYHETQLFDMEASGFFDSAVRFSSAELIRCIKIVSDNQSLIPGRNRQATSDLIHRQIEPLCLQASELMRLRDELSSREIPLDAWRQFTEMASFSQTQKNKLKGLLRYLLNRDYSIENLSQRVGSGCSSRKVIEVLEQLSFQDSAKL